MEQNTLSSYEDYIDKVISGGNYTDKYLDDTLAVAPRLAEGMTKVKYNSSTGKWEKVTDSSEAWYDYSEDAKEWANVVLGDATWNDDGTLDESQPYTQLVWIPRYAYKITSLYHTASDDAGDIEVVFIDSNNQGTDGTTYSTTYPNATVGGGMDDYVVHPAFDFGGTHLAGFWMGKFESSNTGCTTTASTGVATYTGSEVMTVKANVTSWRKLTISNAFIVCLEMNSSGNPYGLSTNDSVVDPHMCKNDEWGAVAYLSQSTYGKNSEVWDNSNTSYITGMAGSSVDAASESSTTAYNTTTGVEASTTGNITGIYDMSGGNWERVAAYVNNGNSNLTTNGSALVNGTDKYKNVYSSASSSGTSDQSTDYALSTPANGHYGDAVYEISSSYSGTNSWYSDYSNFPSSDWPFFSRGGRYDDASNAGIFCFSGDTGDAYGDGGFRVIVPVL